MFKSKTDFNLHIEQLKSKHSFETYLETISYFIENESDQEPEQIARILNKKIIEEIAIEASRGGMLKTQFNTTTSLFGN